MDDDELEIYRARRAPLSVHVPMTASDVAGVFARDGAWDALDVAQE